MSQEATRLEGFLAEAELNVQAAEMHVAARAPHRAAQRRLNDAGGRPLDTEPVMGAPCLVVSIFRKEDGP